MKNNIYNHALHIYSAYLVPIANHISVLHYSLIGLTVRGLTSPALLCCPSVGKRRCARRSHYTTKSLWLTAVDQSTTPERQLADYLHYINSPEFESSDLTLEPGAGLAAASVQTLTTSFPTSVLHASYICSCGKNFFSKWTPDAASRCQTEWHNAWNSCLSQVYDILPVYYRKLFGNILVIYHTFVCVFWAIKCAKSFGPKRLPHCFFWQNEHCL